MGKLFVFIANGRGYGAIASSLEEAIAKTGCDYPAGMVELVEPYRYDVALATKEAGDQKGYSNAYVEGRGHERSYTDFFTIQPSQERLDWLAEEARLDSLAEMGTDPDWQIKEVISWNVPGMDRPRKGQDLRHVMADAMGVVCALPAPEGDKYCFGNWMASLRCQFLVMSLFFERQSGWQTKSRYN